jgi:hypothetical protein
LIRAAMKPTIDAVSMPFLRFSRHALHRMSRWGLSPDDVNATVRAPDYVSPGRQGRVNASRRRRGHWLRVTYTQRDERAVIVTVTVRRCRSMSEN